MHSINEIHLNEIRKAKDRLLLWVVLASKARDVSLWQPNSKFQCLITNFKDEGGSRDDVRMVVAAAGAAACPLAYSFSAAASLTSIPPTFPTIYKGPNSCCYISCCFRHLECFLALNCDWQSLRYQSSYSDRFLKPRKLALVFQSSWI